MKRSIDKKEVLNRAMVLISLFILLLLSITIFLVALSPSENEWEKYSWVITLVLMALNFILIFILSKKKILIGHKPMNYTWVGIFFLFLILGSGFIFLDFYNQGLILISSAFMNPLMFKVFMIAPILSLLNLF